MRQEASIDRTISVNTSVDESTVQMGLTHCVDTFVLLSFNEMRLRDAVVTRRQLPRLIAVNI